MKYPKMLLSRSMKHVLVGTMGCVCLIFGMAIFLSLDSYTPWVRLAGAVMIPSLLFFTVWGSLKLYLASGYAFSADGIEFFYLNRVRRKISYADFPVVVVSNASYNFGPKGSSMCVPQPVDYKNHENHLVNYPFITLHAAQYPIVELKPHMYCKEIFSRQDGDMIYLGICWEDALSELFAYTNDTVYVLEDVGVTHHDLFERMARKYPERLFVITDQGIVPWKGIL